jgi:hypothetical protein
MENFEDMRLLIAFIGADALACAYSAHEDWPRYDKLREELARQIHARNLPNPFYAEGFSAIVGAANKLLGENK